MPKYRVTATMTMGYWADIEAPDIDTAWAIAKKGSRVDWSSYERHDMGEDWTLENISEVTDG
jgi:hypothetical protein